MCKQINPGQTQHMDTDETDSSPAPKRRIIDMGQKVLLEEEGEEVQEVQNKLERERRTRMALEERVRLLEGQLYQVYSRFRFLDSNHKSIPGSGRKEGRGDPTLQRGRSYGDDGNDGADEHGRTPELRGTDHTDRSCQKAGLHLNLYSILVFLVYPAYYTGYTN